MGADLRDLDLHSREVRRLPSALHTTVLSSLGLSIHHGDPRATLYRVLYPVKESDEEYMYHPFGLHRNDSISRIRKIALRSDLSMTPTDI